MPLFAPWKRYQFFMRLKKKKRKKRKRRRRVQTQNGNAWSFARHFWVTIAYDRSFRGGHSSSRHFSCPTCLRASHSQILPLLSLSLSLSSCLSIIFSLGSCMLIQNGTKRITRVVVDTCSSLRLFVVIVVVVVVVFVVVVVVVVAAVVFVIIVVVPVVTSLPSSLPSSFSHPFLSLSLFNCDGCLGGHHELAGR